jgi:hypothetical protein
MRQGLIWVVLAVVAVMPAFGSSIYFADLNDATSFGLLGGTISDTGVSVVTGNVGATTTVTGFPPGTVTAGSTVYPAGDPIAMAAYGAIFNAGVFAEAEGLTPTGLFTTDTSQTFLGNTVYASSGDISSTTGTNLTFNAQNDPTEVFIIQIDGALTVNGAMTFTLLNGAQADNIFWIVGTDATISVGSSGPITFDGSILAGDTFTMSAATGGSGVLAGTINGCVFTENANTLAGQTDVNGCAATTAGGTTGVPEPGTVPLLCVGLFALISYRWQSRRRAA